MFRRAVRTVVARRLSARPTKHYRNIASEAATFQQGGRQHQQYDDAAASMTQRRWIQSGGPILEGEIVATSVKQELEEAIQRVASLRCDDTKNGDDENIQAILEKIRNLQFQLEEWDKCLETEQELHTTYYNYSSDDSSSSSLETMAKSHNRFGILHQRLLDYNNSRDHFDKSLLYYQQLHPNVFDAQVGDGLVALAVLAAEELNLSRAMELLDRAEPQYRYHGQELYGSVIDKLDDDENTDTKRQHHHPKLRTVLEHKGQILRMWNQHTQALELYQEIHDMLLKSGDGVADIDIQLDMADCLLTIGDEHLDEAQRLYQLVLDNLTRTGEEETIRAAAVHHQLGLVYVRRGDEQDRRALDHFTTAHWLRQRLLGEAHALVGQTVNAMGAVQATLDNPSAALTNFRQALMIARIHTEFPKEEDDPEIKQILHNIKIVQRDMEKSTFSSTPS